MPTASSDTARNATADSLRGLAALAVCWFHFTNGNPRFLSSGFLKSSGEPGRLGVEVFFVISGYVVPLSMAALGYGFRDFGRFVARRLVRLDPPYLLTIVVILLLEAASRSTPWYEGRRLSIDPWAVALHLGYLNAFFGRPWLNPVFWSLAIEFQYYLSIAVLFPLVTTRRGWVRSASTMMMLLTAFVFPDKNLVPVWLPLFVQGLVAYQLQRCLVGKVEFAVGLILGAVATGVLHSPAAAVVTSSTALLLASGVQLSWLRDLGAVSYSLYLLHVPIGGRVINLATRIDPSSEWRVFMLVPALGLSLASAWLMYRLVERTSIGWSRKIQLGAQKRS